MAREERVKLPDDFEALLREEMAAVPSVGFLPRVRGRIVEESAASPVWPWRRLAFGGALAALGVAIWLANVGESVMVPPIPPPAIVHAADPVPPVVLSPEVPLRREAVVRRSAVPQRIRQAPVVMVDARQRAAVGALIRLVQEGTLTGEAFEKTAPTSLQPIRERVLPVGVVPLAVSPIADGGVLQAETEK